MEMSDDLLISYLLKEVSVEQARIVENWRQNTSENEIRFQRFQILWDMSKKLDTGETLDPNHSLSALKEKIKNQQEKKLLTLKYRPTHVWMKVAAAFILIAAVAWIYSFYQSVSNLQAVSGQMVKIDTLSDGSVITLNKQSIIEYPSEFKDRQRQVALTKGEAFFNVKPNKEKPFLIQSGGTTIQVVGTSFNVKLKNGDVEVIVESGKVKVSKGGKSIFLEPGEKIIVPKVAKSLTKVKNPDLLYNYYRTKMFIADDTPLWRIVETLNEAYNRNIEIHNPTIRNLPLNTTFKNESLENILQIISRTFKITIDIKRDRIILK
ncbi:FecR family protein [Pedobacter sp. KLB.chiD]|uniref:FecR family protein n=1 Tax=Pedobacter sp. KLB.chiD TaxID=3387402 RepID=UPI00399B6310